VSPRDRMDDTTGSVTRRAALGGAAAAGLTTLLASAAPAIAAPTPAPVTSAVQVFEGPTINLQVLFALGGAAYGVSEVGEVFTAIDQIRARGSSDRAVFEVFLAWGRELRGRADAALRRGQTVTTRDCYLRATMYLDQALFFTLASTRPTRAHEGEV
jgi:hypothetical protein